VQIVAKTLPDSHENSYENSYENSFDICHITTVALISYHSRIPRLVSVGPLSHLLVLYVSKSESGGTQFSRSSQPLSSKWRDKSSDHLMT